MTSTMPTDTGFIGLAFFGYVWIVLILAFYAGVLALIVLGLRWLIRRNDRNREASQRSTAPGGPNDPALVTLRERFARGEIDAEEFEQRRRVLGG